MRGCRCRSGTLAGRLARAKRLETFIPYTPARGVCFAVVVVGQALPDKASVEVYAVVVHTACHPVLDTGSSTRVVAVSFFRR